ncbi:hypothetical protein MMC24_001855 [Lignoscripta atroalba]|nr:hypothetical protein [Lignoscripta atroalba]
MASNHPLDEASCTMFIDSTANTPLNTIMQLPLHPHHSNQQQRFTMRMPNSFNTLSILLSIPTEIRLSIYRRVFPSSVRYRFSPNRRVGNNRRWRKTAGLHRPDLALLRTSKLIHQEAAPAFYSHNTFSIDFAGQKSLTYIRNLHHHLLIQDIVLNLNFSRQSAFYLSYLTTILQFHLPAMGELKSLNFTLTGFEKVDSFHLILAALEALGKLEKVVIVGRMPNGTLLDRVLTQSSCKGWSRWVVEEEELDGKREVHFERTISLQDRTEMGNSSGAIRLGVP